MKRKQVPKTLIIKRLKVLVWIIFLSLIALYIGVFFEATLDIFRFLNFIIISILIFSNIFALAYLTRLSSLLNKSAIIWVGACFVIPFFVFFSAYHLISLAEKQHAISSLKLCPSCNAFQNATEEECPNCGYDLSPVSINKDKQ